MGYDIKFVSISEVIAWMKRTGKSLTELEYFEDIEEDEGSYLSYNFGCFSDIWYERESFGKTTEDFAKDLRAASKELTENKISAEIPGGIFEKTGKPFDGWSSDLRVFHWHIKRLLKLCEDNPACIVLADIGHDIYVTEEELKDTKSVPKKKKPLPFVTYFRHPLKGTVKVDTFEKACEISIITKQGGDECWKIWEELAWKLPGAPSVSN